MRSMAGERETKGKVTRGKCGGEWSGDWRSERSRDGERGAEWAARRHTQTRAQRDARQSVSGCAVRSASLPIALRHGAVCCCAAACRSMRQRFAAPPLCRRRVHSGCRCCNGECSECASIEHTAVATAILSSLPCAHCHCCCCCSSYRRRRE